MVVATEWHELFDRGWSTFCPRDSMVEVAVGGWHPTARKNAGAIATFDVAALIGRGPPSGGAVVNDLSGIGMDHSPSPLAVLLLFRHLASDVSQ